MPKSARKKTPPLKPVSVPILYRLPRNETAELDAIAEHTGHTRSSITRLAVRQWLSNQRPLANR